MIYYLTNKTRSGKEVFVVYLKINARQQPEISDEYHEKTLR